MVKIKTAIVPVFALAGIVFAGCAGISDDLTPVHVDRPIWMTTDQGLVSECRRLTDLKVNTSVGGVVLQEAATRQMKARLARRTLEAGGNVVLRTHLDQGFFGGSTAGTAYACGESQLDRIKGEYTEIFVPPTK